MPRREDNTEIKQGNSRETSRSKREKLTLLAGNYTEIGAEVKKLGATQDKYKKEIKEYMEDPAIYEKNGISAQSSGDKIELSQNGKVIEINKKD